MKEKLKNILDTFHKYNSEHMVMQAFGLSEDIVYDISEAVYKETI